MFRRGRCHVRHNSAMVMAGVLLSACIVVIPVRAEAEPTVPGTGANPSARRAATAAQTEGLRLKVNERGRVSRSLAAVASDGADGGRLVVRKPVGATVRKAYLATATTGSTATPLTQPITVDGQPVPMTEEIPTGIASYNYFSDVTALMKPKLDGAPAGEVSFTVAEPQPDLVDGEMSSSSTMTQP